MPAQVPAAAVADAAKKPPVKKKGGRKLLWTAVACIVLGSGGGGWWWWQARAAAAAPKVVVPVKLPARYYAMEPAFVVNLADDDAVRYLQADVQLMTRDADTHIAFAQHAPAIRNRLLLLFGQQSAAHLAQRSGKERLQDKALAEVSQVLKDEGAAAKVDAVLFTSLVTQ